MIIGGLNISILLKLVFFLGYFFGNDIIFEEERVIIFNSLEIIVVKIFRLVLEF